MKTIVSIFLMLLTVSVSAQKYSKCIVYKHYGLDTAGKFIYAMMHYNDAQKMTYGKTFGCRPNAYMSEADTSCYQWEMVVSYNGEGLMQDSLVAYANGDSLLTKFNYDSKKRLTRRADIKTDRLTTGVLAKTTVIQNYEYDASDRVRLMMQEITHSWTEYEKHTYTYDKKNRVLTDSSFVTRGGRMLAAGLDTVRWIYAESEKYEYHKKGYTLHHFNSAGQESVREIVQLRDRKGRVTGERFDMSPFGVVTTVYRYYPERRKMLEVMQGGLFRNDEIPEIYQYVYE